MNRAGAFYDDFSNALMAPDGAEAPTGIAPAMTGRFAIYRNNVHRGLGDALSAAYPVVCKLVGTDFFDAMAREFFQTEHKRAGSLTLYGAGFADFIDAFPAASSLPYLGDIARLERARLEVLHEADTNTIATETLTTRQEDLASLAFVIHPACRLICSAFPIQSIWLRQQDDGEKDPIRHIGENVLITRPQMTVKHVNLDLAGVLFIRSLMDGAMVGDAYAAAIDIDPKFDVTANFAKLITAGVFAGLRED